MTPDPNSRYRRTTRLASPYSSSSAIPGQPLRVSKATVAPFYLRISNTHNTPQREHPIEAHMRQRIFISTTSIRRQFLQASSEPRPVEKSPWGEGRKVQGSNRRSKKRTDARPSWVIVPDSSPQCEGFSKWCRYRDVGLRSAALVSGRTSHNGNSRKFSIGITSRLLTGLVNNIQRGS